MWIRAERVAVLTPTASLRRLTACYAALAVCAALACTTGKKKIKENTKKT